MASDNAQGHDTTSTANVTATTRGQAIATDAAGNAYVAGMFGGTTDFGGGSLMSLTASDLFVLRLSATGTFGWVQDLGWIAPRTPWLCGVAQDDATRIAAVVKHDP